VTLNRFLSAHVIIAIGAGIAFGLYGPLMIAMFGILQTQGDSLTYWYVASFARLLGAMLFGFGFLLWSIRPILEQGRFSGFRGRILAALLLSNLMALFVSVVQQLSVWNSPAGWVACGVFLLLALGYLYFLLQDRKDVSP
jgi:hypothetical protein